MGDFLVFEGVSKSYGEIRAVDSVSLSIDKGEIFSLLGPSGCGKTTLLRCCAGFEDPGAGRIILDGRDITGLPPHERKVTEISGGQKQRVAIIRGIADPPKIACLNVKENRFSDSNFCM